MLSGGIVGVEYIGAVGGGPVYMTGRVKMVSPGLTLSTIMGLWLSPERTWQLICRRSRALRQTPNNLLPLS